MSSEALPDTLDLGRIGVSGCAFESTVATTRMGRLAKVAELPSVVDAWLSLIRDNTGDIIASVKVAGEVALTCQRCLERVSVTLEGYGELRVIADDSLVSGTLNEEEVVVAPRWRLDVIALVEDELLLALPVVARHEDPPCRETSLHYGPPGEPESPRMENPFAKLRRLSPANRAEE